MKSEDAISRQALKDLGAECIAKRDKNGNLIPLGSIDSLPPASTEETGRWISFGTQGEIDGQIVRAFTCSECGAISIFRMIDGKIVNGDSCANCRAKMEVEE